MSNGDGTVHALPSALACRTIAAEEAMTDVNPDTLPAPSTIVAFNTAAASENRIHDDETARRFGFTGALGL